MGISGTPQKRSSVLATFLVYLCFKSLQDNEVLHFSFQPIWLQLSIPIFISITINMVNFKWMNDLEGVQVFLGL